MLILFSSLVVLWIVIIAYRLQLKQVDASEITKGAVYIIITAILFSSQPSGFISQVYTASINIMTASAKVAFEVVGGTVKEGDYTGLAALAAAGEESVLKVFQIAAAVATAGRLFNIANWIYAAFLVIPYFLLVVAYASQVVVAIFRAMMVALLAPFLFLAFAFGWGRGMAWSGLKTLLGAMLVLFASTAALALIIYAAGNINVEPGSLEKEKLNEFASLTNPQFILIMALGWIGTALMTEGVSLANSIAGTALTNTAAGLMTAGAAATGLGAAKAGLHGANPFTMGRRFTGGLDAASKELGGWAAMGKGAAGVAGAAAGGVASLVDKFKNINKPSGGS
jgi:type IV secretion system protein TrbL